MGNDTTIDWNKIESLLFELVTDEIKRFATDHTDERFYGFALGCNSEYGEILLYLNSPEALRETAIEYVKDPPNQAAFDAIDKSLNDLAGMDSPHEREPKSVESEEAKLRWSLGDWKYDGIYSQQFEKVWEPYSETIQQICMDEQEELEDEEVFSTPTQDQFMQMACRLILRLESSKVFDFINCTEDFKVYVADHDEWPDTSWARLEEMRAQ